MHTQTDTNDAVRLPDGVAASAQRLTAEAPSNAVRDLEERLRQRMDELAHLNTRLQQEIVDHSQTAQRLRASQRTLLESQRLAHIGSWEFDLTTHQAVWSEEMYRIYGQTPGAFIPSLASILACVPPDDHAGIREMAAKAQHSPHPVSYVHRLIYPNGAMRYIQGLCGRAEEPDGACRRMVGIARDITTDREREAALEQTLRDLRQFKEMVNRNPAVVALWRDKGVPRVEFISESISRFGYSSADILSGRLHWPDLVHPDDRARITAEHDAHVAAGHPTYTVTYRLQTASGETRWIYEEVVSVPMEGAKCYQATLLDVTAEREAENRFHDASALNEAIIASAPLGMAVYDSSGQCVFTNPAMSHMVNASVDQLLCQNIHRLASWRESGLLEQAQQTLRSGIGRSDVIHTTSAFGREMWLYCSFTRFQRANEPHLLVVFQDVTERHRAEERLHQSEAQYRQLFESMNEGCTLYHLVYDPEGKPIDVQITAINPAGEAIMGMSADALVGRRASEMVPGSKPLFLDIYAALDQGGPPVSIEAHLDFLKKHLSLSFSSPYRGAVAAIYRDITVRKVTETKMLHYQHQLRHLAAEIAMAGEQERRRIAVELHDGLGQALVLCKMKLESVKSEAESPTLRRQIQGSVRLVEEAIRDTRSLTFQLSPPVLHEIGLSAAIEWLAEHLGEQHGMPISVTRKSAREPAAMAVRVILFQSVRELTLNAIKHARATAIAIDIRTVRGHLEIKVQDDGSGFDVLAQWGSTRNGMGLFNIQERVQLIGGTMTIDSETDKGTGVTLVVPLVALPAESRKGTAHEHSHRAV